MSRVVPRVGIPRRAAVAATVLALVGGATVAAGPAFAGARPSRPSRAPVFGPNLVVNPSFEQSLLESPPLSPNPATTMQPVLPVGWTFEGASLLFDYNARGGHTGVRQVAVSGALGPGRQACDASVTGAYMCAANPAYAATGPVEDASLGVSSIRPFWVTQTAIPVQAGRVYRFSVWAIRPSLVPDAGVMGEGADTKVRWLSANGLTISVGQGPVSLKGPKRHLGWQLGVVDLTAPAGAVGAKLLLGHTDYLVTSAQVAFDDVGFAQRIR